MKQSCIASPIWQRTHLLNQRQEDLQKNHFVTKREKEASQDDIMYFKTPTRICWMWIHGFNTSCVPHQNSSAFLLLCIPYLNLFNNPRKCNQVISGGKYEHFIIEHSCWKSIFQAYPTMSNSHKQIKMDIPTAFIKYSNLRDWFRNS